MSFFLNCENEMLQGPSIRWAKMNQLPEANGTYMICHIGYPRIIYVGESKNIHNRFCNQHRTGRNSAFRKRLLLKVSKSKYTEDYIKNHIEQFLDECVIRYVALEFGRIEFEEYLINKYQPPFNTKGKSTKKSKGIK